MRPQLRCLSDAEVRELHGAALLLLAEMGMRVPCPEALSLFAKAGASVDGDIVCIPKRLVEKALRTVPKLEKVVLRGRTAEHDVHLEAEGPVLGSMSEATHIVDPHSGERRPATNADLRSLIRLIDSLKHVRLCCAPVTPQDVPPGRAELYAWATSIKNTSKHITGAGLGAQGVRDAIKMAELALGGPPFASRPWISFWVLTRPPLQVDAETLEALIEASRSGATVVISSGPIIGMTAPVTLAGAVAQAHAEILSCIVLSQIARPGTQVLYTSFARGMDMKTAMVSMGGPEFALLKGAMAQMGRLLGLPVKMPAMLRDAKALDAQAGFETALTGLFSALSADAMDAMQLDMDLVVDFGDFVFCNEAMAALRRVAAGISVSEETIALEVIKDAGRLGSFLTHDHTFRHFRSEIWQPDLFERRAWAAWERDGSKSIDVVAREKALEILGSMPGAGPLGPELESQIDSVLGER